MAGETAAVAAAGVCACVVVAVTPNPEATASASKVRFVVQVRFISVLSKKKGSISLETGLGDASSGGITTSGAGKKLQLAPQMATNPGTKHECPDAMIQY